MKGRICVKCFIDLYLVAYFFSFHLLCSYLLLFYILKKTEGVH